MSVVKMSVDESVKRIKRIKLILRLLMFLSPLLSVPVILKEIYDKRYYALKYLTFFMALIAYLWTPSGDLYRFYSDFEEMKGLNFNEMLEFCSFDFLMYFLMWIYSKLGLNFEWFRFITCIVEYTLVFSVLKSVIQESRYGQDKKVSFMIFVIWFGLLRFSVFLTGARFTMSLALFIKANHLLFFDEERKKGLFYLLIASLCHYSFWPVFFFVVVSCLLKPNFNRGGVLVLGGIAFGVSTFLLIFFIEYLPLGEMFLNHLEHYTTGYYANGELEDHSLKFRLSQIFSILAFYVLTFFSLWRMKSFKSVPLYVLLCLFCILLINMNSAFNRYAAITIWAILPYFLLNPNQEFYRKDLQIMYWLSIFVFLMSIYTTKRELSYGSQKLICTPLPVILTHTYTDAWIDKNINSEGGFE